MTINTHSYVHFESTHTCMHTHTHIHTHTHTHTRTCTHTHTQTHTRIHTMHAQSLLQSMSVSQEKLLLIKLAELRARKQRVEQLVGLLSVMRLQDEMAAAAAAASASPRPTAKDQEPTADVEEKPSQVAAETEASDMIGLSAEASREGGGAPSELVHDDEAAGMAELQERLRYM